MKIWSVTTWFDGEDLETRVFPTKLQADVDALTAAIQMWENFCEDDWPIQPETWHEIYDEVLNRAGDCMDIIQITEHQL